MRAGLSTIQQTLTPEAASVLNHSIAEAGRRNHGQTTPLHVAATLLASPSGYLRQACIRSHPNSSHPLQCRALELCFSVALERLPTAQNMAPGMDPPISNALMAALKRAQAHQRRGCPEQQQQPLLAVKVELEQLIISILDDPSVSRVMREASFSSPAVKSTIEQTLSSQAANPCHTANPTSNVNLTAFGGPRLLPASQNNCIPTAIPAMPNPYMNRRLMEGGGGGGGGGGSGQLSGQRGEEVRKAVDIMMRSKKRNPVLVGEVEPEAVVKELVRRVEKGEVGNEAVLKNVAVVSVEKELAGAFEKNQVVEKIKELGVLIESKMGGNGGGVILDLGDLKWLVEQPNGSGGGGGGAQPLQPVVSEVGRVAVAEMRKLLAGSIEDGGRSRIWLIGTATCETYLRCQVYHPTMENDWDLQAVPVASRSPMPGMFSRPLPERMSPGNNFEHLNSLKRMPMMNPALSRGFTESLDPSRRMSCCPQCLDKYEQELKLALKQLESSSLENKSEPARTTLPLWLQNAKGSNPDVRTTDLSQKWDQDLLGKQKTNELQRKWNDTCLRLHPSFHQNVVSEKISSPTVPAMRFCNPILMRQPMPSRLPNTRILGNSNVQLNSNEIAAKPVDRVTSPPRSPVRTELALGCKGNEAAAPEKPVETGEEQVKDLLSCLSSAPQTKLFEKFANALDADAFKKLLKGLMEKAWWQQDAASAVASAVTRCRLGNGKRRGAETKGDVWLLFTGPDRIAKRKMAFVLSEKMCGTNPVMVCLGSRRDSAERDTVFRGKTALDRIVEAVRMNPISVILLEDVDEADVLMRGNIKRAMERGRLTDSHGREISLGNVIFILTGNWSSVSNGSSASEKRLASLVSGNWELKLTMSEKNAKRRSSWMHNGTDRATRQRIQQASSGLSFDLNLALGDGEDDRTDGSHSSSDLTVDHDDDQYQCGLEARQFSTTSVPHELVNLADDAIMFKPADLAFIRSEIKKTIATKFSMVLDDRVSIQVDEEAVERIIGGLWHGRASLEEWVEKALAPSFDQLSARLPSTTMVGKAAHLQLELEPDSSLDGRSREELLPSRVAVMVE